MKILVVGATGATGRLLVENLLERGQEVRAILRSPDKLSQEILDNEHFSMIQASLLDLSDAEMEEYVNGSGAVVSCLGHNLTFRGIFGRPRLLVTDATRRLCEAIKSNENDAPIKFVLMNTTGNTNRDISEKRTFAERVVMGLLRIILPPQRDNEKASDYLRNEIGQDVEDIEWVVVRPDTLTNEENISPYHIHPSPVRSAIFNPGRTSRINVGDFMASLIADDELWSTWRGQMPVIYNEEMGTN